MAVGLKTLLEAAQYLEEQEQHQKSPLSSIVNSNHHHHLNGGNHLNNDTNTSCFIAHYSLAVAGNRNVATTNASAITAAATAAAAPLQTVATTISSEENHKVANIDGFYANGHCGAADTAEDTFSSSSRKSTCQSIMKNSTGKQQLQQNIATSAPASSTTGFQQVAFGNGFSLTTSTKTKSPTELFINGGDRKDVNENNNNCSINVNGNKGQLVAGTILQQQQHMNNHLSSLPTNSNTSNIMNNSTNNNNNNNNNNNHHHKLLNNSSKTTINTINNNINDDFDTNSLSPPGPQRVRSASTSSNVYVFGSLDHAKSAANHATRLQANGKF